MCYNNHYAIARHIKQSPEYVGETGVFILLFIIMHIMYTTDAEASFSDSGRGGYCSQAL